MTITIPSKSVKIFKETDVLVVGGGPAGIGAAVAAARSGAKVVLLEKRAFLGGNITASYVETCNHFLHGTSFGVSGIYADMENGYKAQFGRSHDIRPFDPHRFSSEYLKIYLDEFVSAAGVEIFLHSFVNDVVISSGNIDCVIIQSKQGAVAIRAKTIIDCTGDGDVAFAAGASYDIGRDTDNLCQPGTVNFRIIGVDPERLTKDGVDVLREISKKYREDTRAGTTGLTCKRRDIPFGRLTANGQISYVNYTAAYNIDPTDFRDLTRGEMECRSYILEICEYMRKNFPGFEKVELCSIAPEIGFRDSRRIRGHYMLTIDDMESGKRFDDVVAVFPRFYDMLSLDGNFTGKGKVEGKGFKGNILEHIKDDRTFEVPYRCLLPVGLDNLLVAGRCISADHVAESGIRAISLCMYTGQAAGTAAAMGVSSKQSPGEISIEKLQNALRIGGMDI